jgi:hypothetical protein
MAEEGVEPSASPPTIESITNNYELFCCSKLDNAYPSARDATVQRLANLPSLKRATIADTDEIYCAQDSLKK